MRLGWIAMFFAAPVWGSVLASSANESALVKGPTPIDLKLLSASSHIDDAFGWVACRSNTASLKTRISNDRAWLERLEKASKARLKHSFREFDDRPITTGDCRYPLKPIRSSARKQAVDLLKSAERDLKTVETELSSERLHF